MMPGTSFLVEFAVVVVVIASPHGAVRYDSALLFV